MKKVAIIGAGVAGLTCLKSLHETGVHATIFERSDKVGGLWNYDSNDIDGGSPAYESLITNTSKQMMAFSDFRFGKTVSDFPTRADVLKYIQVYAKAFGLREAIRFNTSVLKVEKLESGLFELTLEKEGEEFTEEYDWVVVANGRHESVHIPTIDGLEGFSGTYMHSRQYTTPQQFAGKKVVVVGAASSALDIASEISDYCSETYLSVRTKSWLVPRYIGGKPYDLHLTRLSAALPKFIRERGFKSKLLSAYKRYSKINLRQYYGRKRKRLNLEKNRFVPNDIFLDKLAINNMDVVSEITSIEGDKVNFKNGRDVSADVIIFATGYKISIPFLDQTLSGQNGNYLPLYKQIFSTKTDGLAMCGMCNIIGPIIPALEMQGRFVAAVITEHKKLPKTAKMKREVERIYRKCKAKNINPMREQTLSYLDHLAKELKVMPKLFKNKRLIWKLLTGPIVSSRYRLNGLTSKTTLARNILDDL